MINCLMGVLVWDEEEAYMYLKRKAVVSEKNECTGVQNPHRYMHA